MMCWYIRELALIPNRGKNVGVALAATLLGDRKGVAPTNMVK